jgi:hypothetical protein
MSEFAAWTCLLVLASVVAIASGGDGVLDVALRGIAYTAVDLSGRNSNDTSFRGKSTFFAPTGRGVLAALLPRELTSAEPLRLLRGAGMLFHSQINCATRHRRHCGSSLSATNSLSSSHLTLRVRQVKQPAVRCQRSI